MTVFGAREFEADLTLTVTVERRLGARLTVMRFGGNPGDVTNSQKLSGLNLPVSAQTGLLTRFGLIFRSLGTSSPHPTSRKKVGIYCHSCIQTSIKGETKLRHKAKK